MSSWKLFAPGVVSLSINEFTAKKEARSITRNGNEKSAAAATTMVATAVDKPLDLRCAGHPNSVVQGDTDCTIIVRHVALSHHNGACPVAASLTLIYLSNT